MKIVCLFPGQGSQDELFYKGFLGSQYEQSCQKMQDSFEQWSQKNSSSLFIQPLIIQHSAWIWSLIAPHLKSHHVSLCGHSLGEVTACALSSQWPIHDLLTTGQVRETLMKTCSSQDINVSALLGPIDRKKLNALLQSCCKEGPWLMNDNSLEQIVIGGTHQHIQELLRDHKEDLGIRKSITLPMSVLSHCPVLDKITNPFKNHLKKMTYQNPLYDMRSGADLMLKKSPMDFQEALIAQLTRPVRFRELIDHYTHHEPVDCFIEIGSKMILTNLVKKISPISCYSTQNADKLDALIQLLSKR